MYLKRNTVTFFLCPCRIYLTPAQQACTASRTRVLPTAATLPDKIPRCPREIIFREYISDLIIYILILTNRPVDRFAHIEPSVCTPTTSVRAALLRLRVCANEANRVITRSNFFRFRVRNFNYEFFFKRHDNFNLRKHFEVSEIASEQTTGRQRTNAPCRANRVQGPQ